MKPLQNKDSHDILPSPPASPITIGRDLLLNKKHAPSILSRSDILDKRLKKADMDIKPLQDYLEQGGLPNIYNERLGVSVLSLSCRNHSVKAVECLISSIYLDINMKNGSKRTTALHECAFYGFAKGIELITNHPETNVNTVDIQGQTAVHYAVQANQPECLKLLLTMGARIDIPCNNGQLPIHIAVIRGFHECVSLILDYVNKYQNNPTESNMISKKNSMGYSTMECAIIGGCRNILELILPRKVSEENTLNEKMVEMAIVWNQLECLRSLISHGYPIQLSHMLTAVQHRKTNMVYELSKVVGINPCLSNGDNPCFLYAANHGFMDMIPLLFAKNTSKRCIQQALQLSSQTGQRDKLVSIIVNTIKSSK